MTSRMMGRRLRVQKHGIALSILSLAALPFNSAAAATVTISTATTAPLQTATVNSGAAGDISIVSGGSIAPANASAPAMTLNSNNTVANAGTISFADLADTIGIEVNSGFTGSVTNSGTMTIGPNSSTAGTGVHQNYADNKSAILIDAGTFTGNIDNASGGSITLNGDNSVAIDVRGAVTGAIGSEGTISVVGDHSSAIRILAPLAGNLTTAGTITANGIGSSAILVQAPITGAFTASGAIATSGYDHTTPSTAANNDNATQIGQQSGPSVGIGSSISGGVFFNGPSDADRAAVRAGTKDSSTLIAQATVNSLSSSPALLISPTLAATPGNITLGVVGSDVAAFGLVNRGVLTGSGQYDALTAGGLGVSAEGVRIQGATISGTDYTTTLTGGLRNDGTISATALTNFANGLVIGNLATVPVISNTGGISAMVTGNGAFNATGILIEPGAIVTEIDNSGGIGGTLTGKDGNAYAIRDLAGTVTTIHNTGTIIATVKPITNADGTVSNPAGQAVAVDLSAASNDITFTNDLPPGFDPAKQTANSVTGAVLLGSHNDTFSISAGSVVGPISFGAGDDALFATGGGIAGDLDFGSGTNSLSVDGDAVVQGGLTTSGTVSINVNSGTLLITSAQPVAVSTASFGPNALLGVAVNTAAGTSTRLDAAGTVSFAAGAKIAPVFSGAFAQTITSTILTSPDLQIAGGDASTLLSTSLPFIYKGSISETTNAGIDSLILTLTRKTNQELGLAQKLAPALDAVLGALPRDVNLQNQFLSLSTQATFNAGFVQLLPSYTDAMLATAKQSTMASSRQVRERLENALSERRAGGAWVSESVYSLDRSATGGARGYDAQGTVLGIGFDDYITRGLLAGIELGLDHGSYTEDGDNDNPVSTRRWIGGAYLGARDGKLYLSGSVLGAFTTTDSKRNIIIGNQARTTQGQWHGWRYSADFAASYRERLGKWSITPTAGIEYLHVSDDGYTETGGTDPTVTSPGNAVALQVDARSANAAIAYGQLIIGYDFTGQQTIVPFEPGQPFIFRPELKVGFMHDFIDSPVDTRARFVGDTNYFMIASDPRDTQSFNAGAGFNFETAYGTIGVDANGVFGDHTTAFVGKVNATFRF